MAVDDVISIRGQVLEHMYIPTGIERELELKGICDHKNISSLYVFVCTFIRRSRHFPGEFSRSFHLLSYPYFGKKSTLKILS